MSIATSSTLDAETESTAASIPPASRAKPTMLVVDDEDGPRQSIRVIFGGDFRILEAKDGPSAIDIAGREQVDVAVLDIRMAEMSGIEVLERLKFISPSIEVVMMTAFETNDTLRKALRLQACDYVNKPFDIGTIRAAVDAAMERRSFANEVDRNTVELQQLQSELEQARVEGEMDRTRGDIYGLVIHDLNGPLTVMSGLLQFINHQLNDTTSVSGEELEQVKDRLKRITTQVTSCINVSRRYLSFLRANKADNPRVWVNQILQDLMELLRVHHDTRDHKVCAQPLPEDVLAFIHPTDLLQVLLNLCLNALQCSPRHHRVEVYGQLLSEPLDLSQFADGPEDRFLNRDGFQNVAPLLALSVEDNGPGIPPETLPRIFENFFTSRPKSSGIGTGLGLSIVQRLVSRAHGALHVHSKVHRGTVFTLYVPGRTEATS